MLRRSLRACVFKVLRWFMGVGAGVFTGVGNAVDFVSGVRGCGGAFGLVLDELSVDEEFADEGMAGGLRWFVRLLGGEVLADVA